MAERKTVPVYQQCTASGAVRKQCSGVRAAIKSGDSPQGPSATWNVEADSLGNLVPQTGGKMRGTDGIWWLVKSVGKLTNGAYPCLCERVPDSDEAE